MKFDIKKHKNELDLYYVIRRYYITKENPKTKGKFLLIEMYSNILINMLFLKCRYHSNTEKNIINFIQKYKNDIKNTIRNWNINKINIINKTITNKLNNKK